MWEWKPLILLKSTSEAKVEIYSGKPAMIYMYIKLATFKCI